MVHVQSGGSIREDGKIHQMEFEGGGKRTPECIVAEKIFCVRMHRCFHDDLHADVKYKRCELCLRTCWT